MSQQVIIDSKNWALIAAVFLLLAHAQDAACATDFSCDPAVLQSLVPPATTNPDGSVTANEVIVKQGLAGV